MAPLKIMHDESLDASVTHHEPLGLAHENKTVKEEMDETSRTHHEPLILNEKDNENEQELKELEEDDDFFREEEVGDGGNGVNADNEDDNDNNKTETDKTETEIDGNVEQPKENEAEHAEKESSKPEQTPTPSSSAKNGALLKMLGLPSPPPEESLQQQRSYEEDISLRIHKKVADIAAKAYRRASAQSNVLSRTKLQDIALIRLDELELGDFLGKGSFSDVHEITKIDIRENKDPKSKSPTNRRASFEFASSRRLLASNYCRDESGTYRYAIKFLKESIRSDPNKYAVGTADLVVEGMFLASLTHPNIIKVRGLPEGGVKSLTKWHRSRVGEEAVSFQGSMSSMIGVGGDIGEKSSIPGRGYFLILDRLFDTLGDRIYKEWVETHVDKKDWLGGGVRSFKNRQERKMHLAERLRVAFDICGALKYLHGKRIIYRDLKPENLGFDVRGDIKLFDLGLVKELHPNKQDRKGNYHLSMAGTPRYMAPEVGKYRPYNLSADVYSLSMLLYEIITLEKPLKDFNYTQLKEDVFQNAYRPPIKKVWHKGMRNLINIGWSQDPRKRPIMDEMYEEIKNAYRALTKKSEEEVSHNRRRSTVVLNRVSLMSVRHLVTRASDVSEGPE